MPSEMAENRYHLKIEEFKVLACAFCTKDFFIKYNLLSFDRNDVLQHALLKANYEKKPIFNFPSGKK